MSRGRHTMSLVRRSLRPDPKQRVLSTSAATATSQQLSTPVAAAAAKQQHQRLRVGAAAAKTSSTYTAAPPRAVWKAPPAAAVGVQREARSVIHPEVSHFVLPRPPLPASAVMQGPIQSQQVGPAPPGDLRLVEFMEQVKRELWEFNAMPLRKRFRIQSLLRCVCLVCLARRGFSIVKLSLSLSISKRPVLRRRRKSLLG